MIKGTLIKKDLPASLSIEAALGIPLFLIVIAFFLSLLLGGIQAYAIRYAADQTAEELALLFPIAEKGLEQLGESGEAVLSKILDGESRSLLEGLSGDYASSLFISPFLEKRMDHWLAVLKASGGTAVPEHDRQILLGWDEDGSCLSLSINYTVPTILGNLDQSCETLVPLWSERVVKQGESEEGGEDENEENDDIWSLDNFSRGKAFRDKYGNNLPFNFPVISEFKNGTAHTVRSMDLTSPTYQSIDNGKKTIEKEITELSAFRGHPGNKRADPIAEEDIKKRKLSIVIPRNAPKVYDNKFWSEMKDKANAAGIELEKIEYAESHRYGKP